MAEVYESDNCAVHCQSCRRYTAGLARGVFENWDDAGDGGRYILLECASCGSPFLASRSASTREPDLWTPPYQLYPGDQTVFDAYDMVNIHFAAPVVYKTYSEAMKVFKVDSFDATAIMCRKTLELLCEHFGAKRGSLKEKIEALRTKGIIDDRIHAWADELLREIGNDAAHSSTVSREDAKDALDFCKAIIDYLFVFMPAFKRFKDRHNP